MKKSKLNQREISYLEGIFFCRMGNYKITDYYEWVDYSSILG